MEDLKRSVANIDTKLDEMKEDISDIKLEQVSQAADLKHHIYRTSLAEERLHILEDKLLPILENKTRMDGIYGFLGKTGAIAAGVAAVVGTVVKVIEFFVKP